MKKFHTYRKMLDVRNWDSDSLEDYFLDTSAFRSSVIMEEELGALLDVFRSQSVIFGAG